MFDRAHITDAIKFWERGRVFYNLVLIALSVAILVRGGADESAWLGMTAPLLVLAVIANLLYCAAYPIDLFVQASDFGQTWRSARWALLAFGTLFAAVLAYMMLGGRHVFGVPPMGPHG